MDWKPGDPVPERTEGEVREAFGGRMAEERKTLGLSQGEAAEAVDVSQQVISKLEGKGIASEDVLVRLWSFYDLRVSYPSAPVDPVRRRAYFDDMPPLRSPQSALPR